MTIILVLCTLFLITLFLVYRLLFLKPNNNRMFKISGNKKRVSMSYAVLFDIYTVARVVKKQMERQSQVPVYISAYGIRKSFYPNQSLYEIEETIRDFQYEISDELNFNVMHYMTSYEHMLECWIINSKYRNYRSIFIKYMFKLYRTYEIRLLSFFKMLGRLCYFIE